MAEPRNEELSFDLSTLAPAQPKPLARVVGLMNRYLPGFVVPTNNQTGVEIAGVNFASVEMPGVNEGERVYVHARSRGQPLSLPEADRVQIVSGVCLFGEAGLRTHDAGMRPTGLPRPGVTYDHPGPRVEQVERGDLQIYLPESVARLGRTVVAVTSLAQCHQKPVETFIHIPGPEYRLQAEASHIEGDITLEALRSYCNLIDGEANDVRARFTELFGKHEVKTPSFGSPLDEILDNVEVGSLTPDHFLGTRFEHVVDSSDPSSMVNVNHASYVATYQAAISDGTLPVFVENYQEAKIFEQAKRIPGFHGIGLYPLPNCISGRAGSRLHYHAGATDEEIARATKPWLSS